MELFRRFRFEAAHLLPKVAEDHKCRRLHGHSYAVTIHIVGPLDEELGWVVDFADLDNTFRPVLYQLDHHFLNEIPGLENPTSENLAIWVWDRLAPALPGLERVVVEETCESGCTYTGPGGS